MKEIGVTDMFIVQTEHYNGDDADGMRDAAYVVIHNAQGELAVENENVYSIGSFLEYKASMKDLTISIKTLITRSEQRQIMRLLRFTIKMTVNDVVVNTT